MPEIVYEWVDVGTTSPWMQIHKDTGNLYWNMRAHQMLGYPRAVRLLYDETANSIGIRWGFDFFVIVDDEGLFHIDAGDALQECGLEFPLADHITGEPTHQGDNRNLLIFSLE